MIFCGPYYKVKIIRAFYHFQRKAQGRDYPVKMSLRLAQLFASKTVPYRLKFKGFKKPIGHGFLAYPEMLNYPEVN